MGVHRDGWLCIYTFAWLWIRILYKRNEKAGEGGSRPSSSVKLVQLGLACILEEWDACLLNGEERTASIQSSPGGIPFCVISKSMT